MNSDRIQTAFIVITAMLVGGIATFFFTKTNSPPTAATTVPAENQPAEKSSPMQFADHYNVDLEAAIAAAKAARTTGTLKPLATTPDEFARQLGVINFRMADFSTRFENPPEANAPEFATYNSELQQLTQDLSNLLSDESLFDKADIETPKSLAHYEALMAGGALDLDAETTAKIETLIATAYEKSLPTPAASTLSESEMAAFDKAFDAITAELEPKIRELLKPEQIKRLDAIGLDQALFGLGDRDDD